jgi:hypothetical protein
MKTITAMLVLILSLFSPFALAWVPQAHSHSYELPWCDPDGTLGHVVRENIYVNGELQEYDYEVRTNACTPRDAIAMWAYDKPWYVAFPATVLITATIIFSCFLALAVLDAICGFAIGFYKLW